MNTSSVNSPPASTTNPRQLSGTAPELGIDRLSGSYSRNLTEFVAHGSRSVPVEHNRHLARKVNNCAQRKPHSSTLHLAQNLTGFVEVVRNLDSATVLAAVKRGGMCLQIPAGECHYVDGPFLLQHKFNISKRTAYRHLKNGTTPAAERRIGGDGKTYPAGNTRRRDPVEVELRLTWQALSRADKKGTSAGITEDNLILLENIAALASRLVKEWRNAA